MARDPAEILKEALALPADARAALADSLIESLEAESDERVEEAWRDEIQRRLAELDSKMASPIPSAEVLSRLKTALRNDR